MIRNSISFRQRLESLRGSNIERDLRAYDAPLVAINALEEEGTAYSDAEILARSQALRREANEGRTLDELLIPAFALAREAAHRAVGLRPYAVQVVAALALHQGSVVEMETGEGKTLAAVLPAYLNALTGHGVHILTFNDYLARRDAEWMGPIFRALGLTVGWVQEGMTTAERRRAYAADVTYVTAKEAGFDHLRDLLALDPDALVHRPFHFALVDEADSILIDEARIPLVIAGEAEREAVSGDRLAALVATLTPGVDYDTDEYQRDVELTETGFDRVERELGCGNLLDEANLGLYTEFNCALHAQVLLRRDADYIVRDGRVEIVDEFTGRVVEDRHWPDGLQAAVEAKEGVARQADGRILGSIALQHFLRGYPRLCGMTGTAQDAADEFQEFYRLPVVVLPTHRPKIRVDHPDRVFPSRRAKEAALVDAIRQAHGQRRPILVGTLTVEESERLARRLRGLGLPCQVLNAKHDAREAEIIAQAGALGAVTIATNMAGRGTDIRLGGPEEATREAVLALGGLLVLGTNRHESRRIDRQLMGRAGRQGDPGESRLFISLEDDLLVRFGIRALIPPRFLENAGEAPIDNPVVHGEIARAQRIIEGQNFQIRRTLWKYTEPIEAQRQAIQERRQALLSGQEAPTLWPREPRFAMLEEQVGAAALRRAETLVTLHHTDRLWSDHLALVADLREAVPLVRLGGKDPLTHFRVETAQAFHQLRADIDEAVRETLAQLGVENGALDLDRLDIKGPSSTWTYLIHDDPFREQLAAQIMGPGNQTVAIGAAIYMPYLFLFWVLVERFVKRRRR
jgi:preprotein translocase subunit SecA